MATEANSPFTDILSAALDESGIGDLDDFDLGFTESNVNGTSFSGIPVPQQSQQAIQEPVKDVPATEEAEETSPKPMFDANLDQVDMFTQALQQLSATAHLAPKEQPPIPQTARTPPSEPVYSAQEPQAPRGQLRPPKPPGPSSLFTDPDVKTVVSPTFAQSGSVTSTVNQPVTHLTNSATGFPGVPSQQVVSPRPRLIGNQTVPLPRGMQGPVRHPGGIHGINTGQPVRLSAQANTRIIRLPSGQTIRVPATAQTIRLPSGQTVRLPPRQAAQTVRLPAGQSAPNVRLQSGHTTQTIRLPSGQSKHIIRVPAGQLGQTIRLPSGQVIRLPASVVNRSASQAGGSSTAIIRTSTPPNISTIAQQTSSVVTSVTSNPALPANHNLVGKPAVVSLPNGNIPPGATVIRRQGRTFILQNAPTNTKSTSEQSSGTDPTNQYLSNLLGTGKSTVQVVGQGGLSAGSVKVLQGNVGQLGLRQSPSPSPPPMSLPTLLSRPPATNTPPPITNGALKAQLTSKDVSRLWSNEDIKLKTISANNRHVGRGLNHLDLQRNALDEDIEEEVQELGHAETYANYMPAKVKIGIKHPDPVVETSSLSSVEPQDAWYEVSIPEATIDSGSLSALQLEAIVYASQRHETLLASGDRAGFLIGDGAGVGKGRTVAGIIYENYLQGRKRALWLSVSNDLKVDAERDLRDIGAGKIDVHSLHKLKYAKISSKENGSVKKGVVFSTYSSLIGESQSGGKYRTRLKQLLHWCGEDFDGVIIFDECHKAKNLCPVGSSKPTKTGQTVLELQNKLPNARIVYASATGASEPRNMAYMTRLGLWGPGTPFKEFNDFIQAVEKRGVGAMELVAMDMKLRGMYIARQLSFKGVSFRVEELSLAKDFVKVYNEAVKLWVEARDKFHRAAELIDAEHRMKKSMWGQFWSAHQRFFKYLCISAKVEHCVRLAREAVKEGKCVVIGLQSTGEARTLEQLEDAGGELNDFVSTAKGVFQTLVEKHFPAPDRRKTFDWFGLGDYSNSNSAPASPQAKSNKRKTDNNSKVGRQGRKKRGLFDESDDSDNNNNGPNLSSEGSSSESEDSSPSSNGDSDEEFGNPFGGSDSDDDPWLKRSSQKKTKVKKKKVKKVKAKKTKEKKDTIDDKFDKALSAAGLLKPSASFSEGCHSNSWTNENRENYSTNGNTKSTSADAIDQAFNMKRDLLGSLEWIGDRLPPNTLDHLIDELGGTDNVAEMTGRKGRVVTNDEGDITYESRSEMDVPLEVLNLTEKQRFMDGEKFIAIISEAASSGISLQADRRALNQRRRVHVTLELPWSADRAIQQFGRTHRSNQVNAPEYLFLISELAGERRFASTVAKRLESLGALTHGDRRATETRDLSRFNFDNKYGRTALEAVMKSVMGMESPLVPPPEYDGNFFEDAKTGLIGVGLVTVDDKIQIPVLEKDYNNISKFLNRILGMPVALQNGLFKYFSETLTFVVLDAKRSGRWDMGILDLGSGSECVQKVETKKFMGNAVQGTAKTELYTVCVERGLSWLAAMGLWGEFSGSEDGFYISTQVRNGKRTALLAVAEKGSRKKEKLYRVYRPNTGLQPRMESLAEVKAKYKKVLPDDAEPWWNDQYQHSTNTCSHAYWNGNCKRTSMGLTCEIGLRTREYHVLAGSVLSVWGKVESVLAAMPGGTSSKMQIIRLRTEDGQRIVGSLIPSNCVPALINVLSEGSNKTQIETHGTTKREMEALSMPTFL